MKQNIIEQLNLETECRELKRQGVSIRDIARALTEKANIPISSSAVFRFLKAAGKRYTVKTNAIGQVEPKQNISKVLAEQTGKQKVIKFTCRQPDEYDRPKRAFTLWQQP